MSQQQKYLIVGPSWIGDMVMAQALFIALQQSQANVDITVMAPPWTSPLLQRMPQVKAQLINPFSHGEINLRQRRKLGKSLQTNNFTTAIVLPNSFKSALIPFHAGIPRRRGWQGEWRRLLLTDCQVLDKQKFPLMVQRYVALATDEFELPLTQYALPSLQIDTETVSGCLNRFELKRDKPILVLCPGAEFGSAKQWPADHCSSLCDKVIGAGWQVWILGSAGDVAIANEIHAGISVKRRKSCLRLAGQTSLDQAIDLMSVSNAVVTNDSGLMHIAAALDKPIVALYGSTSTDFTPPLSNKVKLLFTDIDCRPCFQRTCPLGHRRCLTEILPDRVFTALMELTGSQQLRLQ